MLRDRDFQKRVWIILRCQIPWHLWLLAFLKLRCGTFSAVCFCFVEVRFFPFVLSFVDHGYNVCLLEPALRHLLLGLFLFWRRTSLSFRFSHSWPRLNRVRLEHDCNTIVFPRSSCLHTGNARGSVISLDRGFLSWHIPLWRHDIFINLWKAKTGTRFLRESLPFKWINRVCRFDGFPWNWSEHSLVDVEQNRVGKFLWRPLTQQVTRIFR